MILYSCRNIHAGWLMAKFDADFNVESTYELIPDDNGDMTCTCPAWPRRSMCKHCEILTHFVRDAKVDSSFMWCFETSEWHQPLPEVGEAPTVAVHTAEVSLTVPVTRTNGFRRL